MERSDLEQWKAREVSRLLALVETERRYYQEIVAMLPVALVVLSADRHVSSANRAFRQTFGLRSSELRGKTIEQIMPSDRLIEKIRDVHITGVPDAGFLLEHEGRRFKLAVVPMRNWDDESEIETLVMVQDAAGAVASEKPRPEVVIEHVPVPEPLGEIPAIIWEADAATLEFRSARGDLEGLLGFPAAHWTGSAKFFEERIHPEDRAGALEFYRSAGRGDVSAEYRAVTAAGGSLWVRETVRRTNGTLTGVMTSIERRKQLEDQLLRAGRTDALGRVASKLAHDLNNPLMIVTGYAEEMRNSLQEDDVSRNDLNEILLATDRISGITAQLLHYTRRQANPVSPVNVTLALERMEEKIAHVAGEGCAVHITSVAGDAVWAMAQDAQLEEVILALVWGEREDARERSHVSIGSEVDTITELVPGTTLPPGTYTRITIHDNGRGFDAAKRNTVFDGFLSKPGEKGAGPALARAYAIVREWGGDIAFFSEPYRGSTFIVYLPNFAAPALPAVEIAPEPVVEKQVAEAPVEVARETILLVEDEAGIRALVRKILRRENYNVLEAGNAEEAMAMAASVPGRIDLLVTDVMLPTATGRELAEYIRASREDLKVLYISGYTDDDAVRAGAIPPGSKFLQKPFTLGALVSKVRESLATGHAERGS